MRSDNDPDAIIWDSIIPALPFLGAAGAQVGRAHGAHRALK